MIHWMVTAEVARLVGPTPTEPEPADRYAAALLEQVESSFAQCWPVIRDRLAPEIAERIIRGGRRPAELHLVSVVLTCLVSVVQVGTSSRLAAGTLRVTPRRTTQRGTGGWPPRRTARHRLRCPTATRPAPRRRAAQTM